MNVDQVKNAVQNMQNELSKLKLPQNIGNQLQGTFSKLTGEIEKFQSLSASGIGSTRDFNQLASSGNKILQIYNQLTTEVKNLGGLSNSQIQKLFPPEIQANIEKANKAMNDYGQATKNSQKEVKNLESEISSAQKEVERLVKDKEKLEGKKTVSDTTFKQLSKDAEEANEKFKKAQQELKELQEKAGSYKTGPRAKGYQEIVNNQIPQKEAEIAKLEQAWERLKTKKEKALTQTQKDEALAKLAKDIAAVQGNVTQLQNKLANLKAGNPQSFNQLVSQLNQIKGINLDPATATMETVSQAVSNLSSNEMERLKQAFIQSEQVVDGAKGSFDRFGKEIDETRGRVSQLDDKMSQINMLKSRIQYFFGLTNSIMLFRRAITSALNTVKELDATMTEAAVVTKFDVSDMWSQLPIYSKHAQDLGISINGMYQATTLYYQQGLKTNEAMQLGVETMKMAKIAGMDSAQATEAMTAALRGFNMELNEASATRVNDVYSQLAAITASNTEQIATAMEKTASIAASANMEFETTAALLAQIIETTQEAPETAGTAMKTIIARFAEVKSLRDKGLTSGEDEEGEVIDVNKIQTALRSVGISMEGFFSGTEGLDSVLLKLAEKWKALDFETQRYIATMAAGSRQQSRFIAMMSDYGRTTELVGQAQNSAGASQRQFEKTQKSLATSLNRLKNAWDQFQMGLANNEILKAGIDILTKFLETVNKLTDGISGGNGLVKSVVNLGVTIAGLKGAGAVLNGIMASMGSAAAGTGLNLGANLKNSFKRSFGKKTAAPKVNFDTAQTKAYDASLKQLNATMRQTEALENQGNLTRSQRRTLTKLQTQQEQELAIATEQLAAATDLSNVQAQEAALMSAQGISLDAAVIASKAGITSAELQEAVVKKFGTKATEEQVLATIWEIGIRKGQYTAINQGILARLEEIAMTKLGIISTTAQTVALWLETRGWNAKTAAMLVSLIVLGLIIAAVTGLIALIVHLYKIAKANTLEGRMKAAAEATERAKEAAEGAKQAYDDLLSAKSGYDELQNQLDTLTKGTLEWKQALSDSNAQILELLDKYPELAKYLTRGEHGELEINEAGWEHVTEQQAQAVSNANSAVVASQIDETELKMEKATSDLESVGRKAGITKEITTYAGGAASTYEVADTQDIQAIYKKYKEIPDIFNSPELEAFATEIGRTKDEVLAMKDAILKYDAALTESETILQAQTEALLSSQISENTVNYQYSKELIAGMAAGFSKNQEAREQEIKKNFDYGKNESARDSQYFQTLAKEAGVSSNELTGDNTHDLEVLYAKMAGISTKEIADGLKGNADKLAAEIAKMQAAKEAGDQADQVYQAMSKLDEDTQRDYAILMSKDVSNANQEFISEFSEAKSDQDLETMAKSLGFTDAKDMAENFGYEGDIEKMKAGFVEIAGFAQDEFKSILEQAAKYKIDLDKDYLNKMTTEQQQAYVNLMIQADTSGTSESIQAGFDEIFSKATTEQADKIRAMITTFDWKKEGSGEEFLELIKGMGISIDETNPSIKEFIKNLKTIDAVYKNMSLSDVVNETQAAVDEAEKIASQSELSTEQYEKFLKEGLIDISDWIFNGKGWVNTQKGMKDLVEALRENARETFELRKLEAQKAVDLYDQIYEKINEVQTQTGQVYRKLFLQGEGLNNEFILQYFNVSQDQYDVFLEMNKDDAAGYNVAKQIASLSYNFNASSGGGSSSKYENSHDKFYNTYERINALIREREKLERRYDKLLQRRGTTVQELVDLSKQQLSLLDEERAKQEYLEREKLKELEDYAAKNSKYAKYATFDRTTGQVSIDWNAINRISNSDYGQKVDDYISKLEELRDQWQEAQDSIEEIEDTVKELHDQGRDEYFDFENRIKEAVIAARQKEIDELSNINDSINDANSKLLDSIQEQIDAYRQARDNEKTEQELSDKQRRLAYLSQDTSGANAMEILQLQKEIEEGQENYTDQLIDQKISELQKQNDQAAEQRQQQIDLLQAQLKQDEATGDIWEEVYRVMGNSMSNEGIKVDSDAWRLLTQQEDYPSLSNLEKTKWVQDLQGLAVNVGKWLASDNDTKSLLNTGELAEGQQIEFTTADGKTLTGSLGKNGAVVVDGMEYTGVTRDYRGNYSTTENFKAKPVEPPQEEENPNKVSKDALARGIANSIWFAGGGWGNGSARFSRIAEFGLDSGLVQKYVNQLANNKRVSYEGSLSDYAYATLKNKGVVAYKAGGLADFTGPAWLDGTKSKPEYILNADQTKAFFTLVDVLSGLGLGNSNSTEKTGDISYDVDINVESIGSDYDVEQLANKVKSLIKDDAMYRNNNAISITR